jgi:superfamily II DNA/RNA helicase
VPDTTTFEDLGVDDALVSALAADGIEAPFAIQALTIRDALAGRDVCGKAKTGSGKTLAFGLPTLMRTVKCRPGHPGSLILVPTRELAVQVTEVLEPLGKAIDRTVAAVYGGADLDRQVRLINGGVDVVVATPGRLIDLSDRHAIDLDEVKILVVDEADRMADMGFMPQVDWLLRKMTGRQQTLLFSATLDSAVDQLVRRHLKDPVSYEVASTQVTVEEMEHYFFKVHELDKADVAAAIVAGADKALLFVRTKRGADRLESTLRRLGVRAAAIHGDLHQGVRERALADFSAGKVHALVATDVAARGLDIEGVDVVVHFDPPEDHKAYLHRSGRTARAGGSGVVVTLALWNEELLVERLQRRLGLREPFVEMFSNDPRLAELTTAAAEREA